MSDPVSNAEVEDVLASIRRLVSEDGRASGEIAPHPAPKPEADRLVLTPALRVMDTEGTQASQAEAEAEPEPSLELEAEDARAEGRAEAPDEQEHGHDWHEASASEASEDHVDDTQSGASDDEHPDHWVEEDHPEDESLNFDGFDGGQPDEHEAPVHDAEATEAAHEGAGDAGEASQAEPEQPTPAEETVDAASLGSKIAALEAVIGRKQDQWEPDGVDDDAYSGTDAPTMEWEDHSDAEHHGQYEPDDLSEVISQDDDAVLDEESLRDMVAEIVRQELQGALGERITRNVRKLVRREIHRALAAQELE